MTVQFLYIDVNLFLKVDNPPVFFKPPSQIGPTSDVAIWA